MPITYCVGSNDTLYQLQEIKMSDITVDDSDYLIDFWSEMEASSLSFTLNVKHPSTRKFMKQLKSDTNWYRRYVRTIKRRKEKLRRKMLKEGEK